MILRQLTLMTALGLLLAVAACGVGEPDGDTPTGTFTPNPDPKYPADVLDLKNWKLTLPVGREDEVDRAAEIRQPCLAKACYDPGKKMYDNPAFKEPYSSEYFRLIDDRKGVVLRAPVDGVTTSGSDNARTELRELFEADDEGKEVEASWSNEDGVHTMELDAAITATPAKYPSVVTAQIHDGEDDVVLVKLRGSRLFVDADGGDFQRTLDDDYQLGAKFTLRITASEGVIEVEYNDQKSVTYERSGDTFYFKAGVYNQSNLDKVPDEDPRSYGEVVIYKLAVTHED